MTRATRREAAAGDSGASDSALMVGGETEHDMKPELVPSNASLLDAGPASVSRLRAHRIAVVDLVAAAARGDVVAWEELVDRFAQTVWSTARSGGLDVDEASDVFLMAWSRLAQNLERFEEPVDIEAWLADAAHRESLRFLLLRETTFAPVRSLCPKMP
jgi:hypothetical protein